MGNGYVWEQPDQVHIKELDAEIASLRAELAAVKAIQSNGKKMLTAAHAHVDELRAELAEVRAEGHQEIANVVSNYRAAARQDAEEIARLKKLITSASFHYWNCEGECGKLPNAMAELAIAIGYSCPGVDDDIRATIACPAHPARNRPLPETRCDCCDNGMDDAWEFCPFCGQRHPDATDALACRPQGEKS